MGNRRLDARRLKIHRSYDVNEVAKILGCHKQTVRHWLKQGLKPVDDRRPTLIQGLVVQRFLDTRRTGKKRKLKAGELYCFKCRQARNPALDSVDLIVSGPTLGNLQGLCPHCTTIMNRRVSASTWRAAAGNLHVKFRQPQPSLDDSSRTSVNTHFEGWRDP